MNVYLLMILLYAILLIFLGWFIGKHVKGAADFFVAGRNLDWRLLFTTLLAANIGAGSTVGVAGIAYKYGISSWWWIGSSAIGSIFLAYFVGPKIWQVAKKYNLYTLGDYLDLRYAKVLRAVISLMMSIGTLALFSGQLIGIAWILNVVAGLEKIYGTLIGAVVVVVYFGAGGLLSATIVNILELVVILAGFIIALPYALAHVGGVTGLQNLVGQHMADPVQAANYFAWDGIGHTTILGYLIVLVPAFCISPGLIGKIYGAKDVATVKLGTVLNAAVQFVFAFFPVIIGMCAFAAFPNLEQRELALPMAMKELMPFAVSALALAAIFAAEVSTADAVLYMLATSFSKDLYKTFIDPEITEEKLLRISRIVTGVAGILGVIMALYMPNIITALQIFYSLMSVSLAAPFLFGLFSQRASVKGAFIAAGLGVSTTLYLQFFAVGKGIWILNAASTGILVAIIAMFLSLYILPNTKPKLIVE